jgi:phosphatidate cytidylyltransferase
VPEAGGAPPTRARPWLGTELGARVASALVLAAFAIWLTYIGDWPFALLWLAAGIAILAEWIAMARIEPALPITVVLGGGLVALSGVVLDALSASIGMILAAAAVSATIFLIARTPQERWWALAGFAYAAVLVAFPPLVREHPRLGVAGVLWMFAVVWVTDTAAYFAGRRFGGPKLWPSVSPKKTWSGFAGGLAAGTAAGVAVPLVALPLGWTPPAGYVVIALVSALASVLAQLGDLGESAMKRRFGVKDSGRLIPGHGGVMDRLDGFWAVSLLLGAILAGASLVRT